MPHAQTALSPAPTSHVGAAELAARKASIPVRCIDVAAILVPAGAIWASGPIHSGPDVVLGVVF